MLSVNLTKSWAAALRLPEILVLPAFLNEEQ